MNILNLYFSSTGNTEKVALRIEKAVRDLGERVDTQKMTRKDMEIDILNYDFIFAGSGVYGQLPGKPVVGLFRNLIQKYARNGEIVPGSPRRPSAKAVIYCTYGGTHTGINEAIPAVKYMGQLFDHLGYAIVGEWYIIGEYHPEKMRHYSVSGRLGDIRERPGEQDLRDIEERVKGVLKI